MKPENNHPQSLTTVPEKYLTAIDKSETDLIAGAVAPWVANNLRLQTAESNHNNQFRGFYEEKLSDEVVLSQANQLLADPATAAAFNKLINAHVANNSEDATGPASEFDYAGFFLNPHISHENRRTVIDLHTAAMTEAQNRLNEIAAGVKADFIDAVKNAVENGVLPANALLHAARLKSFENLGIFASDPVVNRLQDIGGEYDILNDTVYINALYSYDPSQLKSYLYHEFCHAFSGKLLTASSIIDTPEMPDGTVDLGDIRQVLHNSPGQANYNIRRSGLRGPNDYYEFNEAVTEFTAMQLLGEGYSHEELWAETQRLFGIMSDPKQGLAEVVAAHHGIYEKFGEVYIIERMMLAGLIANGVDEKQFLEAYFEPYKPAKYRGNAKLTRFELDDAVFEATDRKCRSLRSLNVYLRSHILKPKADSARNQSWEELKVLDGLFS